MEEILHVPSGPDDSIITATIDQLVIISINVHGCLLHHKVQAALTAFTEAHEPDILVLPENGIQPYQLEANAVHLNDIVTNYHAMHIPSQMIGDTEQRGVSLLYHVRWKPEAVQALHTLRTIRLVIKHRHYSTHILGCYAPSKKHLKDAFWESMRREIQSMRQRNPHDQIVLIGDLNIAPDPALDRQKGHRNPLTYGSTVQVENENLMHLLRTDSDTNEPALVDAWRLLHGAKRGFTWERIKKKRDDNSEVYEVLSRSRIDLALVTPKLMKKVTECEILSAWAPLTDDHFPIRLVLKLPEAIPNIPVRKLPISSNITVWKYKIEELKDPETLSLFQRKINESLSEITDYRAFQKALHDAAECTVKKTIRPANPTKTVSQQSPLDRSRTHCVDVLSSRNHLLLKLLQPSPDGGRPQFQCTHSIEKLCRLLPNGFALPPHRTDMTFEEAESWFLSVARLYRELTIKQLELDADAKFERIMQAIERSDLNEVSRQKAWYQAANIVKNSLKSRKKQTLVINEVDPKSKDVPEYEPCDPVSHRAAIRKYWANLMSYRDSPKEAHPPWLSDHIRPPAPSILTPLCNEISREELGNALAKLKLNKASGYDHIPAELLQALPEEAITILQEIFNGILRTRTIPEEWKLSHFYTLHKSGDVACCSNYRPIALLSVPYKLFMTVLTARLTQYVEQNGLLSNTQGGFRKSRGCLHKVALLKMIFSKLKAHNRPIHAIFIDLVKAYDSVPIDQLLQALRFLHIPEDFCLLLEKIYENRKGTVITVHGDTDPFDIERGLAQGDPISPLLFNLFLEPLLRWLDQQRIESDYHSAYADDVVQVSDDVDRIQMMLHNFTRWAKHNALEIGISDKATKTVFMTNDPNAPIPRIPTVTSVKGANNRITLKFSEIPDRRLPVLTGADSYKYLGVWINTQLNWEPHIKSLEAKLNMMVNGLRHKHYNRRQTVIIVNRIVIPMVTYGAEVVPIPAETLKKWDTKIQTLVNGKMRVWAFANKDFNFLPAIHGGVGLISVADEVETKRVQGLFNVHLNSIDSEAKALAQQEWHVEPNKVTKNVFNKTSLVSDHFTVVENPAYSTEITNDSLLHLFIPTDPRINILARKGITSFNELVDGEGCIKKGTLKKEQYQSICVGKSRHVRPHLLERFGHPAARTGVPHNKRKATFYTDASKTNSGIGIGIFCPSRRKLNISEPLDTLLVKNNTEAEIIALATAITAYSSCAAETNIYCDSTAAISVVSNQRTRQKNLESLELVSLAQRILKEKGDAIKIHHVYSHTAENPDTEWNRKRVEENYARFGSLTDRIVRGNSEADQLAKNASEQKPSLPPLQWASKTLPRFLLCTKKKQSPVGNIRAMFHQHRSIVRIKKLQSDPDHYDWLSHSDIDWNLSKQLLDMKHRLFTKPFDFAMRCRRGLTNCKADRYRRQSDTKYWLPIRYQGKLINSPNCDGCGQVEDRFHFLYCSTTKHLRDKIQHDVEAYLTENTIGFSPHTLPCFWHEDRPTPRDDLATRIQNFAIEDAARGLISRHFAEYISSLDWKDNATPLRGLLTVSIIILEGLRECWVSRCKLVFANAFADEQSSVRNISRRERLQRRLDQRRRAFSSNQHPD